MSDKVVMSVGVKLVYKAMLVNYGDCVYVTAGHKIDGALGFSQWIVKSLIERNENALKRGDTGIYV